MKQLKAFTRHCISILCLVSGILVPLLTPSAAIAGPKADAGYLGILFVGNTQVTISVQVGPNHPTIAYKGTLTRNGEVLRQSGNGSYTYHDSGLTRGESYTYRLRVYGNQTLVFDEQATVIAGRVQGYVDGNLTMSGEWTLYGDVDISGALTLSPGATLRGIGVNWDGAYYKANARTMWIDHATVISASVGSWSASALYTSDNILTARAATVQNGGLAAADLTVTDSTLSNTALSGQIRRLESNTGSCSQSPSYYGDAHFKLLALPGAAVAVRNNQMLHCWLSLDWNLGQSPQAVSIISNTFASLWVDGVATSAVPVEIRDNVLPNDGPIPYNNFIYAALILSNLPGKVSVTGNTIESMETYALTGPDTFIRSNTFTLTVRTLPHAMEFGDPKSLVIEGNTLSCADWPNPSGVKTWGILLRHQQGYDNRIVDNAISGCNLGIEVDGGPMTNTLIMGNRVTGGGYKDGLITIDRSGSAPQTVRDNIVTCEGDDAREYSYGIQLAIASNVQVLGNVVRNCGIGMHLFGGNFTQPEFPPSTGNVVRDNLFINNAQSLVFWDVVKDNTISNNQFRRRVGGENFFWDYSDTCTNVCYNTWDLPKSAASEGNIVGGPFYGGNYWSDYAGVDADGDRLGDTPYPLVSWEADDQPLIGAPGPDLFVKPFILDPSQIVFSDGKYLVPVKVRVYNVGEETAEDIKITYSDNSGKTGTLYQTSSLISGAYREPAFEWDITPILLAGQGQGTPELTITAVQYGPNPEGNTRNNRYSAQTSVDARPRITGVQPLFPLVPGYYLDRTDLENPIRVQVDWNGDLPGAGSAPYGSVAFDLNGAQVQKAGHSWGAEHTYNMGQDFLSSFACANNTLRMWAEIPVSGGVFRSLEATLQPTVFPFPQWVEWAILNIPGAAAEFTTQIQHPRVQYDYRFKYPDPAFEAKWTPPEWLPYVGGKELGIVETQAEALASGRNDGIGRAGVGGKTGLNLAAVTASGTLWGGGTARFKCGASLDLERVALGFSINVAVEKEAGIVDVVPAVKAAENVAVVGRLIKWVNRRLMVKATFAPEIAIQTEFVNQDDALVFDSGEGTGSLDAKVALELEVIEDLKGSVYGGGKPYITLQTPAADPYGYLKEIGLDMYFGATYTAWQFEDTFERRFRCSYPGACLEVEEDGNIIPHSLALVTTAAAPAWQLIPRAYLGDDYARLPASGLDRLSLTAGQTVTQTLLANTYPYLQPALAITGSNTLMLAYVHDDPAKPHGRGTEIYAIANNPAATPVPLTDDAYPDFSPVLAFSGEQALALWERAALSPEITPTLDITFAQSLEIAAAVWNGSAWSAPLTLTTNTLMDHAPRLAPATDGSTLALWQTGDGVDVLGTAAHPLTYTCAWWDGAAWLTPTAAITGLHDVLDVAIAAHSASQAALVYVRDMDGDLEDLSDTELFYSTFDGAAWSAPARLTTDTLPDAAPALAYDAAGVLHLIWLRDDRLASLTDSWDHAEAVSILGDATQGGFLGFELTHAPDGNLALVWQQIDDDGAHLTYSLFDATAGAWSLARPLDDDPAVESAFSPAFTSDGSLHVAYQVVETNLVTRTFPISGTGIFTVTHIPELGRSDLAYLVHTVGRDLAWESLTVAPPNPARGATITLTAILHNAGDLSVAAPQIQFLEGGFPIVTRTLGALTGGMTVTVQATTTLPYVYAPINLAAVADPAAALEETDEANNTITLTTILPDLAMDVLYTEVDGGSLAVTARLSNSGVLAAGAFSVTLRAGDATTGTLLGVLQAPQGVSAGAQITLTTVLTDTTGWPAGADVMWATVDAIDAIFEADETNNTADAALPFLPDLTLTATDITGNGPLYVTVHNVGLVDAADVVVELHEDAQSGTLLLLYSETLASIPAGSRASFSLSLPAGEHTLYISADPANAIAEAAEGNNLAIRRVSIFNYVYLPLVLRQ
jgi:hypothetical protein